MQTSSHRSTPLMQQNAEQQSCPKHGVVPCPLFQQTKTSITSQLRSLLWVVHHKAKAPLCYDTSSCNTKKLRFLCPWRLPNAVDQISDNTHIPLAYPSAGLSTAPFDRKLAKVFTTWAPNHIRPSLTHCSAVQSFRKYYFPPQIIRRTYSQ